MQIVSFRSRIDEIFSWCYSRKSYATQHIDNSSKKYGKRYDNNSNAYRRREMSIVIDER